MRLLYGRKTVKVIKVLVTSNEFILSVSTIICYKSELWINKKASPSINLIVSRSLPQQSSPSGLRSDKLALE